MIKNRKSRNRKSKIENRKSEKIGKSEKNCKIGKNRKIEQFQNLVQTMGLTSARRASRSPTLRRVHKKYKVQKTFYFLECDCNLVGVDVGNFVANGQNLEAGLCEDETGNCGTCYNGFTGLKCDQCDTDFDLAYEYDYDDEDGLIYYPDNPYQRLACTKG